MIYDKIFQKYSAQEKMLAVLVDPDKTDEKKVDLICKAAEKGIDFFFVGGSLILSDKFTDCIHHLKTAGKPVIIFPGNHMQISSDADAILFLSLISGRNPEMLIGRHVIAAPAIRRTNLEVIPTGYILIDGGEPTSVSYMSNTIPIPYSKNEIAAATALAGQMLGQKLIYLETGSGSPMHVSAGMIKSVKNEIDIPLIAGGGIRTPETAAELCSAGADIIVIGTAFEESPELITDISIAVHTAQTI